MQYKLGDRMKDLYWLLFKNTGKIEYYLKYVEEDDASGGNNR